MASRNIPTVKPWKVTYETFGGNGRLVVKSAEVFAPTRALALLNFRAGDVQTPDFKSADRFCPIKSIGRARGQVFAVLPVIVQNIIDAAAPEERRALQAEAAAPLPVLQARPRSLAEIARDVRRAWKDVYFGARPYLDAMGHLDGINESFGCDSAASIVRYFLANATSFRGDVARRVKLELKEMLKSARR